MEIRKKNVVVRAAGLRTGNLHAPITVRFSEADRERVERHARRHGVAVADVVRLAVMRLLDERPKTRER